jgi:predicted phage tail protein
MVNNFYVQEIVGVHNQVTGTLPLCMHSFSSSGGLAPASGLSRFNFNRGASMAQIGISKRLSVMLGTLWPCTYDVQQWC